MVMDGEMTTLEGQIPKKGRHRKKQLYNSLMQQMEFYFSDSNLSKDKFLLPLVEEDPFVDISIFMKFNKIRKLTTNLSDMIKAINNSQLLELSEDKTKVKRKNDFVMKSNADNCTLYIERIKVDATHEWLASIFSEFGNVAYVSIPKYKHNKANKGFAFIEYEKESEAAEALSYFESIGCKMSTLMPPENLCSIVTYEGSNANAPIVDNEGETDSSEKSPQKKRKCSTEETDNSKKKLKIDNTTNSVNEESKQTDDFEEKKKKKQKKMRRKLFKELGLQVLSKEEWKKIRNRYLDNQKAKMKQLKQFLNKKKYGNPVDIKPKVENKNVDNQNNKEDMPDEKLPFIPGAIVKTQVSETCPEAKVLKEELQEYSSEIKFVDVVPTNSGSDVYVRFSDNDSAKKFCTSEYKGVTEILEGKEEEEYWNKINSNRTLKLKKNKKHLRGREKLLKKAEKELGKHIKFDDAD